MGVTKYFSPLYLRKRTWKPASLVWPKDIVTEILDSLALKPDLGLEKPERNKVVVLYLETSSSTICTKNKANSLSNLR